MKPRTKIQLRVNDLFLKSEKVTHIHHNWAEENLVTNKSIRLKTGKITCLRCAYEWIDKTPMLTIIDIKCPGCGRETKVQDSRNKNFDETFYWNIVTTESGFQIVKTIRTICRFSRGKAGSIWHSKIGETWFNYVDPVFNFGQYEPSSYREQWAGGYELRNSNNIDAYCVRTKGVYPEVKVLPIFKRNGFRGKFHNLRPVALLDNIMTDTMSETLIKAKQYALLYERNERSGKVSRFWKSIKICMRNKYIVKEGSLYLDYLYLLDYFNKDLSNAKYCCPKNLKKEHDYYMAKKKVIDDRLAAERAERDRERNLEYQRKEKLRILKSSLLYKKRIKAFSSLIIQKDNIVIVPMLSVEQFKEEGDLLKHCIYSNKYYNQEKSLILSARIDGLITETIEVSLKSFEVLQCRGKNNSPTAFNKNIIEIMEKNMDKVKKIVSQIKKQHSLEKSENLHEAAA